MKKYVLLIVVSFMVSASFAQQKKEIKLNKETNLIEATYFHENGQVSQKGTFDLAGKLQGDWVSYNDAGDKTSEGSYEKGVKTGKWLFWEDGKMKEVVFDNNIIASVIDKESKSRVVTKD
ncbi:toxin-antitoxin system YwqK family antitoxin [Maribacter algicola]|uniref:Toxin-antitoxin system YwqK family antitoxin n=1 Tax=Meishania litoralis TaxID=3434685 RepID=A0ACC7LHF4_9FLAO